MSTELEKVEEANAAAVAFQAPADPLSEMLVALLADPEKVKDYPIATVESMFAMVKENAAEGARGVFFSAMNRVQSQLLPVKQRGKNADNHSTFAKLEDVQAMVDPILIDEGFSYSFSTTDCPTPEWMRIVMTLRHNGRHEERHMLDAPIDNVGPKGGATKTKLHGVGSTYSYVERILLCKVLGVQTYKDDDGCGGAAGPASQPISEQQCADLLALLTEVSADMARFLRFFRIEKIEQLPVSRYREAMNLGEAKRAKT